MEVSGAVRGAACSEAAKAIGDSFPAVPQPPAPLSAAMEVNKTDTTALTIIIQYMRSTVTPLLAVVYNTVTGYQWESIRFVVKRELTRYFSC